MIPAVFACTHGAVRMADVFRVAAIPPEAYTSPNESWRDLVETQKDAVSPTGSAPARGQQDIWKAIAWMSAALVCFVLTAVAGRAAGEYMSVMHMVFWRNLISTIILLAAFQMLGISLASLKSKQPMMQMGRAWIHFAGQWCWMQALLLIPLVELFALEFTAPLWVAVIAPLLLSEKLTAPRIVAAVLGFIGAMIIIRPDQASMSFGSILAITCALLFALNIVGTRYLTRQDGPLTIIMFMTVNHTILAFILGFSTLKLPELAAVPWIVLLGVASLLAHFGLAFALKHADAIVVAPMDFMRLPMIAAIGMLFYNEPLEMIVLLGTAIVLTGNVVNLWGERRTKAKAKVQARA
jgi:drug/metabolite transporter (DMT)-like permease